MSTLNHEQNLDTLLINIQEDKRLKAFTCDLQFNNQDNKILILEENIKKNICVISYSLSANYYKIEHWGGIENTAFNIRKTPELVLTSIILNETDCFDKIKEALLKAFAYETIYYQWIQNGNNPKIIAKYSKTYPFNTVFDNEVQYKVCDDNSYYVTNKRLQTFHFSSEEFFKNFTPISNY